MRVQRSCASLYIRKFDERIIFRLDIDPVQVQWDDFMLGFDDYMDELAGPPSLITDDEDD